jgi:hypothetical protein
MITIRQHGDSDALYDIACFLSDIDSHFSIDAWQVNVEECIGARAIEVEKQTSCSPTLPDAEFRALYREVYQTIDGTFVGYQSGAAQFRFVAFDSSFWEISSTPVFEAHMLHRYGAYHAAGA